MKIIPKFQNSGKFPDIEKNKRKQQFLNQNGVKVKIDGSWGPWQEQQYRRLTTKNKYYHTTPLGFLSYLYDKTLGNGTTYQEDPAIVKGYSGEIKPDNRSAIRRYLDQQMQDNKTPLGYITQTVLPSAAVAEALVYGGPAIVNGIRTTVSSPSTILPAAKTLVKEGVKGAVGVTVADAASKATTGKTLGEQIAQSTGVSPDFGEFTIPGSILSPLAYNTSAKYLQNSKILKIRRINKELNKGIKENSIIESYNKIPANKDIGTVQDYLDFLDNIFPKSKMNGIYYHGGPKGITQFESAKNLGRTNKGINSGTKDYGIYFADDKELAKYYASTHPKSNRELYTVKLNMDRPVKINTNNWYLDKFKGTKDLAFNPGSITQKWYDKLNLKQYNSIYHNGKSAFSDGEIVMFNPEDIHIMGTPQESAMFREYKRFPIKRQVQLNEDIPTMQQQYDFGFKNIIKAAKPGVVVGTPLLVSSGLLIYELNRKRNKERERSRKNE